MNDEDIPNWTAGKHGLSGPTINSDPSGWQAHRDGQQFSDTYLGTNYLGTKPAPTFDERSTTSGYVPVGPGSLIGSLIGLAIVGLVLAYFLVPPSSQNVYATTSTLHFTDRIGGLQNLGAISCGQKLSIESDTLNSSFPKSSTGNWYVTGPDWPPADFSKTLPDCRSQ